VIEWLEGVLAAVDGLGTIGYVLFWIAYVLATILLIPEWIFTVMDGVLFGLVWGSLVSWIAASTGTSSRRCSRSFRARPRGSSSARPGARCSAAAER